MEFFKQIDNLSLDRDVECRYRFVADNELGVQETLIGELNDGVDATTHNIRRETRRVNRIMEKSKSGGAIACIVLLILILAVGFALNWGKPRKGDK